MRQATSLLHFILVLVLARCVLASRKPQVALRTTPLNTSVSWQLFTKLEALARLVDVAYCVNPSNPGISYPFNCLSRCSTFSTLELVTTWYTGLLVTDSAGFIALDHASNDKRVVVAFRGTLSLANVVVDLATVPQAYVPYLPGNGTNNARSRTTHSSDASDERCNGCTVHMGFLKTWQDTREQIMTQILTLRNAHPDYRIELVGHSLGGAVAILAGLEMEALGWAPTITTFGQPRVGNAPFAARVDAKFRLLDDIPEGEPSARASKERQVRRVTHLDDPVPLLPLADWGYVSHAGEIFIGKADVPPDVWDLRACSGNSDALCSEGPHASFESNGIIGIPRYNPLSALSSHRNYFWTLGLCLPDSWKDPGGWH